MSSKTVVRRLRPVRPVRSWCAPSGRVPPKSSGRHLAGTRPEGAHSRRQATQTPRAQAPPAYPRKLPAF
jgi:hypothetical protein